MIPNAVLGFAVAAVLAAAGCDASKAELERTRSDLAAATVQRDDLRAQLEVANIQISALTKKLSELTAKMNGTRPARPSTGSAGHERASKRSPQASQAKSKA